MRDGLLSLVGRRATFTATFWQYGIALGRGNTRGVIGRTILLRDIRGPDGRDLCDHVWINYTAGFDALGEFACGDQVKFTATVAEYEKGYYGNDIDERLKKPRQVDIRLKFPRDVERMT